METPTCSRLLRLVALAALVALGSARPVVAQPSPAPQAKTETKAETPTYLQNVLPLFMGKCSRCHHPGSNLGNWLNYQTAYTHREAIERRIWASWKGHYYKESMPVANTAECQAMTAKERALIKDWVEAGAPRGAAMAQTGPQTKAQQLARGEHIFATICSLCHQKTALGIPGKFPPLAGSDFLNANKDRAISTVLHGRHGVVVVNGHVFNNSMPTLPLSNQQVADVLTYVYNSFGNSGKRVTASEVKVVRSEPVVPDDSALALGQQVQPPPPDNNPYE